MVLWIVDCLSLGVVAVECCCYCFGCCCCLRPLGWMFDDDAGWCLTARSVAGSGSVAGSVASAGWP